MGEHMLPHSHNHFDAHPNDSLFLSTAAPHVQMRQFERRSHRNRSRESEESAESDSDNEDHMDNKEAPLEEDTYGYVIASIVRDLGWLTKGSQMKRLRVCRLASAVFLLILTIALQVTILYFVRQLLSATSVHRIRKVYSHYESVMYPNRTTLLYHTSGYGYHRGVKGSRVDANFAKLDDDEKDELCAIPLSQPLYLTTMLFIWALTCTLQLRQTYHQAVHLLLNVPTVKTMKLSTESKTEDPNRLVVVGLTAEVKAALVILVFFPQVFMTLLLCWLGSRWLTATADLSELLLNCVALEFVLLLPKTLYNVLVPMRSKMETQSTYVMPDHKEIKHVSTWNFFSSFLWGLGAAVWVLLYVFLLQHVLVEYRWDIADICEPYLSQQRIT